MMTLLLRQLQIQLQVERLLQAVQANSATDAMSVWNYFKPRKL